MIIIIFCSKYEVLAFEPCSCHQDRIISLTEPMMQGDDIKSLQTRLKELDYYQGPLDGKYGTLSLEAINKFKKDYKMEQDGIVDQKTWDMLGNLGDSIITSRKGKEPVGELSIIINLAHRTLSLLADGKVFKTYPITVGKKDTPSPVGEWYIKNKYKRIDGGPLGSRWMGLNVPWGVYGIHGTNKPWEISTATSLGCIRLNNFNVEELFDWVKVKTPVKIIGRRPEPTITKRLHSGNTGYDVMELQARLRETKFYEGYLDGIYEGQTIQAVNELKAQFDLRVDGRADGNIYNILGIEYSFN